MHTIAPAQKLGQSAQKISVFENIIHAHTRIWFYLIGKHLTARKLTDSSQEEEPEAAENFHPLYFHQSRLIQLFPVNA